MIVLDQDPIIRAWAEYKLDSNFGHCYTIANVRNGKIVACIVFSNFRKTSAEVSLIIDKGGASKDFFRIACGYAFDFCKWNRVNSLVSPDNLKAIKINEKFGFKKEGYIRKAADNGGDLILYGMLREECRWFQNQVVAQPLAPANTYH